MIDTLAIKNKILNLAMRGQLTEQLPEDGTAEELYAQITKEKASLIKRKKIKEKPLGDISDENTPFDIPPNWKWVYLGEIFSHTTGKALNASDNEGKLLEYITTSNVYWDYFELDNLKKMYFKDDEIEKCTIREGDLLICEGGDIGRSAIWCFPDEMRIQNHIHRLRPYYSAISPHFYYYVMRLYKAINMIKGQGIGLQGFSSKRVHSLVVPLPPVLEQERIVSRIEVIFELLDKIDVLQNQYASNKEALKSKLVDAAIQGKLTEQLSEDGTAEELYQAISENKKGMQKRKEIKNSKSLPEVSEDNIPFEIPSNWKWVHLDDITTKITSGNTPTGGIKSNVYVKSGNCFFREQNIYNDGIHNEGMVYITDDLLNTRKNSTVVAKDILLNITGGSIGRCALIPDDFGKGSINQHILIIRMVDDRLRFYVHKFLCSPYAQKYIKGKSVGDKDGFSGGRCKQMLIPLPPLAEQKRIAERIEELLQYC